MDVSNYQLKDAHDPRAMRPADLTDIVNQAFTSDLVVEPVTTNLTSATPQDEIVSGGEADDEGARQMMCSQSGASSGEMRISKSLATGMSFLASRPPPRSSLP